MDKGNPVGALQLSVRLRGVSPPVTRRLLIGEQILLAELHSILQAAFGWPQGKSRPTRNPSKHG
jgi:hypothetical protein